MVRHVLIVLVFSPVFCHRKQQTRLLQEALGGGSQSATEAQPATVHTLLCLRHHCCLQSHDMTRNTLPVQCYELGGLFKEALEVEILV